MARSGLLLSSATGFNHHPGQSFQFQKSRFHLLFRDRLYSGIISKEFEMIQDFSATLNIQKSRDIGRMGNGIFLRVFF